MRNFLDSAENIERSIINKTRLTEIIHQVVKDLFSKHVDASAVIFHQLYVFSCC
jgi:hypothetical protein